MGTVLEVWSTPEVVFLLFLVDPEVAAIADADADAFVFVELTKFGCVFVEVAVTLLVSFACVPVYN